MPKIRGVKPDLWTDENFVELSPYARLLWIGLWNHACDNGHLQDKSKQIKMRILPTDDVNCVDLLREIAGQRLIEQADGWITIPNLSHHQKPHKRWWTTCDKPGCVLPEGTSHAPDNRSNTVAPPKATRSTTADGDCEGDGELKVRVTSSAVALVDDRIDVDRLCLHLAQRIDENGAKRPRITKAWKAAARLMLDVDGRPEAEVHQAIEWATRDPFWMANILSMPKLREKYDQLKLQAQRPTRQTRQQETDGIFERSAQRLGVVPGGGIG
jgi:hypothetical protein